MRGASSPIRAWAVASVLVAAALAVPPATAQTSCRYEIVGQVAFGDPADPDFDPFTGVEVTVYDLRNAPGTEAHTEPASPAEVRDDRTKRILDTVTTDATGSFTVCVASDGVAETGTLDVALGVEADAPGIRIYTPPLVGGTVNAVTGGAFGGGPSTATSEVYTAFSGEHRNVAPGRVDLGTFAPLTPDSYPFGYEQIPGDGAAGLAGNGDLCTDDGSFCVCVPEPQRPCDPGDSDLPIANRVGAAFRVLSVLQDAREAVLDLDRRAHGDDATGPGSVRVVMPYDGCGNGCYYGGGLITLDSSSTGLVLHEYGHHIEARYAPSTPSGSHGCREHGQATDAWSGGFANVLGALVYDDSGAAGCGDAETSGGADGGQHHEVNVQGALWDLVDDDTEDAHPGDEVRLWRVFSDDDADYDDYEGFHDRWIERFPDDASALQAVACLNGMTFVSC